MSSAFLRHRHLNEDNQPPPRLAELQKHAEQSPTADAIPGEIITACDEYKYDTVIPIVYPNQPITIPFYAISDAMTAMQFAALSIPSSIEATFDRPNASPPLSILRQTASQARVLGIGHAGVVIINGETGQTRYYEYGRYGGPFGQVREATVADVSLEDYCNPSSVSLHTLSRELTRTNGGPYAYEAAYIKLPDGAYEQMEAFAEGRKAAVAARTAAAYNINDNHCFTFALEVAQAGGANADVSSAEDLEVLLRTRFIGVAVDAPEDLVFELPSRQIQVLQRSYTSLSVGRDGQVPSNFTPPTRP